MHRAGEPRLGSGRVRLEEVEHSFGDVECLLGRVGCHLGFLDGEEGSKLRTYRLRGRGEACRCQGRWETS